MLQARIEKLENIYKPTTFDMPLLAERAEGGYVVDGKIIDEERLNEMIAGRKTLPKCPAAIVID